MSYLKLTGYLALASLTLAAYEFMLTRAASLFYFFDVAYLVLAVCLLTMAVGALAARTQLARLNPHWLLALQLATPIMLWPALTHFHFAWVSGLFSLPFLIFGALAAYVWHELNHWSGRTTLYAAELAAGVIGLALLGPALLTLLPLGVNTEHGVQTHLKRLIADEGLVAHQSAPSAWAQTDLIETERSSVRYVFTDGMFVTRAVSWDGESATFADHDVEEMARLKRLAFAAAGSGPVALLGAGAGFDIAVAIQSGATAIDVVEINPATLRFAHQLDDWAGGVMSRPGVTIYEDDARRFINRQQRRYSHINITLIETAPANARARHHVAARILTREAIDSYLRKLGPEGLLTIIQNTDAIAASTSQLLQRSLDETYSYTWFTLADDENPFRHLFIVGKLTDTKKSELAQLAKRYGAIQNLPPERDEDKGDVSDNRPFFFEQDTAFEDINTVVAGFCIVLIGLFMIRQRHSRPTVKSQFAATVAGASALMFQLLAIYHVQSVVGLPGLALAMALTAVLGGAGLGALLLRRYSRTYQAAGLFAAGSITLLTVTMPEAVAHAHHLSTAGANLLVFAAVTLCSLPIGLPFLAAMHNASLTGNRSEAVVIGFDGLGGLLGVSAGMALVLAFGYVAMGLAAAFILLCFATLAQSQIAGDATG